MLLEPLLSVCLVTYNQEAFIEKVLEGAVMQKASFPYEIVIGEDCSTDSTRAICKTFAQQYPNKIVLLPFVSQNLGLKQNFLRTFQHCRGKYIAYLEGDDYWIDPYKLQKQVDILERNNDVVLVHTNCKLWDVKKNTIQDHLIEFNGTCIRERQAGGGGIEAEYIGNFRHVKTSTCVYRKEIFEDILQEDIYAYTNEEFPTQDFQLFQDMAYRGRYAFIDEDTTVIALGETLSVSSNPTKNLQYRIGFHKIGRYYIEKYRLRPEVYTPWLQREMHWMLNFGMHHPELATEILQVAQQEKQLGYLFSLRQKVLITFLQHPILRNIIAPLYNKYYQTRER